MIFKKLNRQPISRNGRRLNKGDVVRVLEQGCSCKTCAPFKDSPLATIAATQDEDEWLYANDFKGGEEPLLRLRTSSGGRTGCCFRACNVDFVRWGAFKEGRAVFEEGPDSAWCIPFELLIQ